MLAAFAPIALEYVLFGHSVHTCEPSVFLYVPVTQDKQAPPFESVYPALYAQLATAGLPAGDLEFVGHARHVSANVAATVVEYVPAVPSVHNAVPASILYLPAIQSVHAPPSGPVHPALHVQAARAELAIGELELLGHARQVAASEAPVATEYVPAAQFVHASEPVALLYEPASHDAHGPVSGPV